MGGRPGIMTTVDPTGAGIALGSLGSSPGGNPPGGGGGGSSGGCVLGGNGSGDDGRAAAGSFALVLGLAALGLVARRRR